MPLGSYNFKQKDKISGGPLVSVVTPFYNTADYLEECIESVCAQTYENWEYILVDNCSTDMPGAILEKYTALNPRIRVVKENVFLGQVENYNRALCYIAPESKYCKIVQADDWIFPNCLAEMVAVAESNENVGLISSFSLYGDLVGHGGLLLDKGPIYPGHIIARTAILGAHLFGSPTAVMYRSDIVRTRNPFYSIKTLYFEDTEVCYEILRDYNFGFIPQILTYNRRNKESTIKRMAREGGWGLCKLMCIYRFGPDILGNEEYNRYVLEVEGQYYHLLAQCALNRYERDFWEFHAKGLESIGQKLSYKRVVFHALAIIIDKVMNPKQTFEGLWSRVMRRII